MPTVWVESGIQELSSLQRRHLNWCPDVVFWFWSVSCFEALQIPGGSSLTTQSLEMWILTLLQNATMLKGRVLQIIIVKDAAPCIISSKCIEDNVPSYNSFFFFLITSKCHFPLFWYFFFDFALLRCSFLDRNLIAVLCWGVPFNFKVEANVWFSNSFSLEKVLSGFLLAVGNGTRLLVLHVSTLRQSFSYCSGPFWSNHLLHSPHLPPSTIGHHFRKIEPGKSLLVVLAALKPPILCSVLWQESYIWLASAMELVLIHLWRKEFRTTFFTVIRKEKWLESDTSLEVNDLMTFFRDKKWEYYQ